MKKILKKYPDWNFKVIGDNGSGPNHKTRMKEWMMQQLHAVMNRVTFIDGVDYERLPSEITDCEIVLLPSLFYSR